LRVAELVGLDVQDSRQAQGWLDMAAGLAHVLGKGSKRRSVPVGSQALQAVQQWMAVRQAHVRDPDQVALFVGRHGSRLTPQSIWQRLRQRARQAGLAAPVHPHMMRHSFASHSPAIQW